MIISRTPYRISLFGGGSDYPAWSSQYGGAVLGFAINKYSTISLRVLPPFFQYRYRVVWSKVELVQEVAQIQHPVVRTVLQGMAAIPGLEIHHDGDLPAGSGLGSGSSFTVGMLHVAHAFQGRMASPEMLARDAIHMEHAVLAENMGRQNQILAAHGGFQHIVFSQDGSYHLEPVLISRQRQEQLQASLMMVFTGHCRDNQGIIQEIVSDLPRRARQLTELGAMPAAALAILRDDSRPLRELGELLHTSWRLKQELAPGVGTPRVAEIYQAAREAGAVGGKLTGVGGGGFLLLFVEPQYQARVRQRLRELVEVSFEIGAPGSKIVVYEPDDYQESC